MGDAGFSSTTTTPPTPAALRAAPAEVYGNNADKPANQVAQRITPTRTAQPTSAALGARALLAGQLARLLLTMLSTAVLARLLTPDAFGMVASTLAVTGIAGAFGATGGLSMAAMRAPQLTRDHWNLLFWCNTALGCVLTLGMAVGAPFISARLGNDHISSYLAVASLIFLFNGIAVQFKVRLIREGRFSKIAALETAGMATGLAVAVILAATIGGPWPLILQVVIAAAFELVAFAAAAGQAPGRLKLRVGGRELVRDGAVFAASTIIESSAHNIPVMALGATASPAMVGVFTRAERLTTLPQHQLAMPLYRLAIPLLSKLHGQQLALKIRMLMAAYGYSVGVLSAIVGGMAASSVALALGGQWTELAPPIVRVLAVGVTLMAVTLPLRWGLVARGSAKLVFWLQLAYTVIISAGALLAAPRLGAVGVAWAFAGATALRAATYLVVAPRNIRMPVGSYFASLWRLLLLLFLIFAGTAGIELWAAFDSPLITLMLGIAWAVGVLGLGCLVSREARADATAAANWALSIAGTAKRIGASSNSFPPAARAAQF